MDRIARKREKHHAARVGDRQGPEHQAVDEAEDCGVGAEAESEREDDDEREARLLEQHACAEAHVAPGIFDRSKNAHFARALFYKGGVAELAMRGVTRFGGLHSGGAIFIRALCEMEREFVAE